MVCLHWKYILTYFLAHLTKNYSFWYIQWSRGRKITAIKHKDHTATHKEDETRTLTQSLNWEVARAALIHTAACMHASFTLLHIRCPCKARAHAEHRRTALARKHVLYVHTDSAAPWAKLCVGLLRLVNRMRSWEIEAGALVSLGLALGFPAEDKVGKYNII